ncbi:MAG: lysoplasmalogenase, partial [Schleiferiaceae bacterium]|nr:lysoplasmalogenase [Schleiferiaceae bacterium]
MKTKQFNRLYFSLLLTHLFLLFIEPDHSLVAITKPTLLISLIGFYIQNGFKNLFYPQKLFVFGLVFSLLGDVLLIQDDLFIYGLGAFLIAQLCYTFAFIRSNFNQKGLVQKRPLFATPVLAFLVVMIYTLKPMVGELLPAIVLYATVISLMLLTAINRFGVAQKQSAQFVFWGALLFVLSD